MLAGLPVLAQPFSLIINQEVVPNYGPALIVKVNGDSNTTYMVESSTNLINWDELYRINGQSGLIVPTNKPAQFYRAKIL